MPLKIIDNFGGRLVRDTIGDMNSGLTKYGTTFGNQPFINPGNLTWSETATQIDPAGAVITDLIMDGKVRVESGITYVYCIGHLGRVYKIQVNDPASFNSNYDNPVLLTTLTINSPTFTRGGSIDFYGATSRIYIGSDMGVTQLNFDGTGETFVGLTSSWVQLVPRPFQQFVGKLFVGNGSNIATIDSTLTVTTYTTLTPGFPSNTQVRDLDLSPDGNYLEAVVTDLALPDLTSSTQDTTYMANSTSYIFKWNGTDNGYTSFNTFPSFSLNANIMFGPYQYTFGYDVAGSAVFDPINKALTPILTQAPLPNAVGSNGNLLGWATTEFYNGFLRMSSFVYGSLDKEIGVGWWRQVAYSATGTETDVLKIPFQSLITNFVLGSVTNGYAGGLVSPGKAYFSTLETSAAPTKKYKLYKWYPVPIGLNPAIPGVYETQQETSLKLFRTIISRKFKPNQIRFYVEPLVANNSFQIDIIGSNGNPMPDCTKVFTVGVNCNIGDDFVQYNTQGPPTYSMGIRITNLGTANWVGAKLEIDYEEYGVK